jgi:hypothetical protein
MNKILIPAKNADDWKQFLAEPNKHWKVGYSARALAYCWQEADGIPDEVAKVLAKSPLVKSIQTIFAIPEHKVNLPGGAAASQNDVWVLAETPTDLVSIAVEGKVSESFGPTIGEWFSKRTSSKEKRLRFLCNELGLSFPPPDQIRYQLLHRTVSAILEAKRFKTNKAVMLVHSFSQSNEWFDDYKHFLQLFGLEGKLNDINSTLINNEIQLIFAWVKGSPEYLEK